MSWLRRLQLFSPLCTPQAHARPAPSDTQAAAPQAGTFLLEQLFGWRQGMVEELGLRKDAPSQRKLVRGVGHVGPRPGPAHGAAPRQAGRWCDGALPALLCNRCPRRPSPLPPAAHD